MKVPGKARRVTARAAPGLDSLESRELMSNVPALPDIAILGVHQQDARTVIVDYEIKDAALPTPAVIQLHRSGGTSPDGTGLPVGSTTLTPGVSLDLSGRAAGAVGKHSIAISTGDGLGLNPSQPYVVATANGDQSVAESNDANNTASYRIYTIGVITHGGKQSGKYGATGPPWENRMARSLKAEGYDTVIPFNWVKSSSTPGAARGVASYLLDDINAAAMAMPPGVPIDLHMIAHSEGAVVNSEVLKKLSASAPPGIQTGYVKDTMLDPHAANNNFNGAQLSAASNPLGLIARMETEKYQARANDPLVAVPPVVDLAEVFYQHTPANRTHTTRNGVCNLWGQVPVQGIARYYDITADGVSHSGTHGVAAWYQRHIVPSLSEGAPIVEAHTTTIDTNSIGLVGQTLTVSGNAAPGARVNVKAISILYPKDPHSPTQQKVLGKTQADVTGRWTVTGVWKSIKAPTVVTAASGNARRLDRNAPSMRPKAIQRVRLNPPPPTTFG